MELIVDLHIHSRFARATSRELNVENIYKWSKIKGINVIGSGDFTHPAWFGELREKLEPAEPGLYKLKDKFAEKIDRELPLSVRKKIVRFVLSVEISNIYKRGDKVRRLHNLVVVPGFTEGAKMISRLDRIGNLKSDGRPILGLDSEELLKITQESGENNLFIPAHIWTPWFAMFGSKSGFDSIEEAFGKSADKIVAIETGLSSDPFMNWRVKELRNRTILSGSDAHSLPKMAREANLFDCDLDYFEIREAIYKNDERMVGTIEFFPQEGMYHFDGHRKCKVVYSPTETKKKGELCPVCGNKLILGVDHRVGDLADRGESFKPEKHKKVEYIIPMLEIIAEVEGVKSIFSKRVLGVYDQLISKLGDELTILRKVSGDEIKKEGLGKLAVAIERVRRGEVKIEPGYDGVYGKIKIFSNKEREDERGQMGLGI